MTLEMKYKVRNEFLACCAIGVISLSLIPYVWGVSQKKPEILKQYEESQQKSWKTYSLEQIATKPKLILEESQEITDKIKKIESTTEYYIAEKEQNLIYNTSTKIVFTYLILGTGITMIALYRQQKQNKSKL